MSSHVMLSLDLNKIVDSESRSYFYGSLERSGWSKSVLVDTTWTKVELGGDTPLGGGIGAFIVGDLGTALLVAHVSEITYMYQVSNSVAVQGTLKCPAHLDRFR